MASNMIPWAELKNLTSKYEGVGTNNLYMRWGLRVSAKEVQDDFDEHYSKDRIRAGALVFADTFVIDEDVLKLPVPLISIVARTIEVKPTGAVIQLVHREGRAVQLLTQEIMPGELRVSITKEEDTSPGTPEGKSLVVKSPPKTPRVLRVIASNPTKIECLDNIEELADDLKNRHMRTALSASFRAATRLVNTGSEDARRMAIEMFQWVHACCAVLTNTMAASDEITANLQRQSFSLLSSQMGRDGVFYVPILSDDFYKELVEDFLKVAEVYDNFIKDLADKRITAETAKKFAQSLKDNYKDSFTPLSNALDRTYDQLEDLRKEIDIVIEKYREQQKECEKCRKRYEDGEKDHEVWEIVNHVLNVIDAVAQFSVAAAELGVMKTGTPKTNLQLQTQIRAMVDANMQASGWLDGGTHTINQVKEAASLGQNVFKYMKTFGKTLAALNKTYKIVESVRTSIKLANRPYRTTIKIDAFGALPNLSEPLAGYMITQQSLDDLKAKDLPGDILNKLKDLLNKPYDSEKAFLDALNETIKKDLDENHKSLILQHSGEDLRNEDPLTLESIRDVVGSAGLDPKGSRVRRDILRSVRYSEGLNS